MKKMIYLLIFACSLLGLHGAEMFQGPFQAESLAFYWIHPGGPLKITVDSKAAPGKSFAKVLSCFYDASERQVGWKYDKIQKNGMIRHFFDYGKNAPKGIYQLRVAGISVVYDVKSEPAAVFGLMPLRCRLNTTSLNQFSEAWFLVPKSNGDFFKINHTYGDYELFDSDGKSLLKNKNYNRTSESIDVREWKGKILKLRLKLRPQPPSQFSFSGIPMILCPTPEAARRIGASLIPAKNGKNYAFPFQLRILDFIGSLKEKDLVVKKVPPANLKSAWEKEPNAVAGLNGLFQHLNAIIDAQKTDSSDPQFGFSRNVAALSIAAGWKRPVNPYYKNPAMIKRALLGIFHRYLELNENGTLLDSDDNYSGLDCFEAHKLAQAVYFLSPVVSAEERELLQEGIRRIADRFPFYHVTCENQSTHWLMLYQHLAMSNLPLGDYARLAADYSESFADPNQNPFVKTGYLQERYGPDATYQGLACCMLAVSFRYTENPRTKELLRTIYDLFNHSVAPEPDGTVSGSSGFSHRTAGTWVQRQWGAGTAMMAGFLPEAAVWHRKENAPVSLENALREPPESHYKNLPQWLIYPAELHTSFYSRFLFPSEPLKNTGFPAENPNEFQRDFNGEFLAVRKNGIYSFAYAGMTSAKWVRSGVCRKPGRRDHRSSWNPIQGLQLVHTKEYGSLFTSVAWNSSTYAMPIALLENGTVSFPDYWTLQKSFDAKTSTLVLRNRMFDLPVELTRTIRFTDKGVEQKLEVVNLESWHCVNFYEQLPLLVKSGMKLEYCIDGKWGNLPGIVSAIRIRNSAGAGFLISLKQPCQVVTAAESENHGQKILPLRFLLGNNFSKEQKIIMEYTIKRIQ